MAAASSPILLHPLPIRRRRHAPSCSQSDHPSQPPPLLSRRLVLSSPTLFIALSSTAKAQDIPLFGLRKKLRKIEEEAGEAVKEGIVAAEKEVEAVAEEGIEAVEGIGLFSDLAQAAAVAAAEVVGVLVGVSVVNGILGPEGRRT